MIKMNEKLDRAIDRLYQSDRLIVYVFLTIALLSTLSAMGYLAVVFRLVPSFMMCATLPVAVLSSIALVESDGEIKTRQGKLGQKCLALFTLAFLFSSGLLCVLLALPALATVTFLVSTYPNLPEFRNSPMLCKRCHKHFGKQGRYGDFLSICPDCREKEKDSK